MVHHGRDATGETSQKDTAELNLEKESGVLIVRGSPGVRWPRVETQQDREDQPTAGDGSLRKHAAGSTGDLVSQDGNHPARTLLKDTAKAHLSIPF